MTATTALTYLTSSSSFVYAPALYSVEARATGQCLDLVEVNSAKSSSHEDVTAGQGWPHLLAFCRSLRLAASPPISKLDGLFPDGGEAGAAPHVAGLRGSCPAAAALVRCLLHPSAEVRRAATTTTSMLVELQPSGRVAKSLATAMLDYLRSCDAAVEGHRTKERSEVGARRAGTAAADAALEGNVDAAGGGSEGNNGARSFACGGFGRPWPAQSYLLAALKAIVPPSSADSSSADGGLDGSLLPSLALLCHHPAFTGQGNSALDLCAKAAGNKSGNSLKAAQTLWRQMAARAFGDVFASGSSGDEEDEDAASAAASAAAAAIIAAAGPPLATQVLAALGSDCAGERCAGLQLAASLAQADTGMGCPFWDLPGGLASAQVLESSVVPALFQTLKDSGAALQALSSDQWELLQVADGTLLQDARKQAAATKSGKPVSGRAASDGGAGAPVAAAPAATAVKRVAKTKGGDFGAAQEELAWEEQVRFMCGG